ncbi:ATP synthase F0 subunit B [Sphingomonadaceae bacterium LXI357]|uniref:ATP synthase subunit b n=2 Tax=Stakelama marina TaxID=2826939 RepID=A0A8T4IF76_9SPHN|nr:ATP synthase F0 subunit B [Stakelama marina]
MVWLVVAFAILYFGIVKTTLPRLGRTIDARENQIMGDLDTAGNAKAEADRIQAEYEAGVASAQEQARARLADARSEAAKAIEAKLAETNAELNKKMDAAEASLEEARAKAVGEIEAVAAEAAAAIVEKLTGTRPDEAEASSAARAALA